MSRLGAPATLRARHAVAMLALGAALAAPHEAARAATPVAEGASAASALQDAAPVLAADPATLALRALLAELRAGRPLALEGRPILSRSALPRLYAAADDRPLWRDPRSVRALLAALAGLESDGLDPEDYHRSALAALADATGADMPARRAALDLLASDALVLAIPHLYHGKVDPVAIEPTWNIASRVLLDEARFQYLQRAIATTRIERAFDGARPVHPLYARGREALAEYRAIAAGGGWPVVPAAPRGARAPRPGDTDARVPVLRQRLAASGDYVPQGDPDSRVYDDPLAAAVRTFQARHALTADALVGRATLAALNVPAAARVDQIRVNLERARWVLHAVGDGDLVVIDIAGYNVRYLRGERTLWQSRAIVGLPYRQTPVFRSRIERVTFNPTWTVPPTILAEDILPGQRRGENVLARKGLRLYDRQGREVDPSTVDWATLDVQHFPYVLRQGAGDDNALGRVKIDFPNPHLVYVHDTPARDLFDRDERTFSSGCIRVEDPLELARRVLDEPQQWDAAAIRAAVATGRTRTVKVARPVPVLLMYWTIDAGEGDRVVFRRDVYSRDARLLRALDAAPAPLAGP